MADFPKCWKCGHQWHGAPCTEVVDDVYASHLCPCKSTSDHVYEGD